MLLDFPAPELLSYPRETVVAEKFEAMTKLDTFNSRMKDFYDIWILSRQFSLNGASLADAISQTFANRQTAVTAKPVAWTPAFSRDNAKQTQWQGFVRKSKLDEAPADLSSVIDELLVFLQPVAEAIEDGVRFEMIWLPPGPWSTS